MEALTKQQKRSLLLTSFVLTYAFIFISVLSFPKQHHSSHSGHMVLAAEKVVKPRVILEKPVTVPVVQIPLSDTSLTAKSVYISTTDSAYELYSKNSTQPLPIASLTKLMAAYVIVEEYDLNQVIEVPSNINTITGSEIFLTPNDRLTVKDLLSGALIASGNDAIYALAFQYSGGVDAFVSKMNEKAQELGLSHTHYTNPIGFDEVGNVSTVQDISVIARRLQSYSVIKEITTQERAMIQSRRDGRVYSFVNTNPFITLPDITGLKTGTSPLAGENLVLIKSIENESVIIVIVGAEDRNKDARTILAWLESNHL